jgi:hypothetical protein
MKADIASAGLSEYGRMVQGIVSGVGVGAGVDVAGRGVGEVQEVNNKIQRTNNVPTCERANVSTCEPVNVSTCQRANVFMG